MADQNNKKVVKVYATEEDVAVSLAKYVADLSAKFAKERGSFTVVLSGGYLIDTIRVVPKNHVDSNYKLAFDGFLSKVPIPPGQVSAINDALSAEGAAEDYQTGLKHLVDTGVLAKSSVTGFPKFDLMLLGMGPDGHVASLFPGHPLLEEKVKWVTHIMDSPKPPPQRITFTFPVINSSAYIAMVVCGPGEVDAVYKALGKNENPVLLPVQRVTPEEELKWFLDEVAASKLQE
ncbi:hypothetical protein OIU77_008469 [Salix suchowensis]|uniref:Probable 6-phosphogluconolactonase n=1 Tax=Salix suchowensis TaxID=1278906 RepID=A0ABQ9ALW5_9ROSI|nr:hypothetical protein OIU77_008469 [Salix suchowensis]